MSPALRSKLAQLLASPVTHATPVSGGSTQLKLASDQGRASSGMRRKLEQLFGELQQCVGPPEPPARLHGDLWSGNSIVDEHGAPLPVRSCRSADTERVVERL